MNQRINRFGWYLEQKGVGKPKRLLPYVKWWSSGHRYRTPETSGAKSHLKAGKRIWGKGLAVGHISMLKINEVGYNWNIMPIPSIEGSAAADAGVEVREQKPKTLPCRYCLKRFRRLEHVQRHERTHTKEKPFRCGCGKTFGRRDLLVRHEKLVHFSESSKDNNHTNSARLMQPTPSLIHNTTVYAATAPNLIDPDLLQSADYSNQMATHMSTMSAKSPDGMMHHRAPGCSLDLLSDAANHLASTGQHLAPIMPEMAHDNRGGLPLNGQESGTQYDNRLHEDTNMRNSGFPSLGPPGTMEEYNLFLDDFGPSSHYFLPALDTELPANFWSRPAMLNQDTGGMAENQQRQFQDGQEEHNSFSRFGSRLPSLQPETRDAFQNQSKTADDIIRTGPPWKISPQDHRLIQNRLDDFANVLPKGFSLPSRHTLSRFWEGYINGFHEHLPFLHIPTISAANCAPELMLALAAVGAQYRFECHRGNGLWYASKAIALEQIRRRHVQQVLEILTPPSTYRSESVGLSPVSTIRPGEFNNPDVSHVSAHESETQSEMISSNSPQAQMETIQALLLLMAMGTWGPSALLREALCLQAPIALLVRELGLQNREVINDNITWEDWILLEGEKRTKFIAYCFFNLQCIAYDMPPLILSSEINLNLPCSVREWKAENYRQWREARRAKSVAEIPFHEALEGLFTRSPMQGNSPPVSSMGNYILINAIVQQIFFVRQTNTTSNPGTANNSLRSDDIDELGQALRSWQAGWNRTPESSLDPSSPNGPVAFNSTALLRLAYIRLHSDLGSCRRLDTRDPIRIAAAFKNSPPLIRSARLGRAVLQSAHALSIPVRIGIAFVARTQTFSWSIQHSLCNLECAFLLSKWLETIAMSPLDLTNEERNLLEMVRSMLDETEFAVSFASDNGVLVDEHAKIRQLGSAVVRLWAETFKGTHIFDIVKLIGSSLEIYAQLLEKENEVVNG